MVTTISNAAWAQIEAETTCTLKRYLARWRVVDVQAPGAPVSLPSAPATCRRSPPKDGIVARQREMKALDELRVPFELVRQANDSDWQPAKDAARKIAFAEDGAVFEGYTAAGIVGIRKGASNPTLTLPADVRECPEKPSPQP